MKIQVSYDFQILTYLAAGLSKKEAIDALIDLHNPEVTLTLAQNPHLSSTQLATLYKDAPTEIAVLIASRLDLSEELIWEILKGKGVITRQALITRYPYLGEAPLKLSDAHVEYILEQPWFTADYASALSTWYPAGSRYSEEVAERRYDERTTSSMHSFKRIESQISGIRGGPRKPPYDSYKAAHKEINYHSQDELRKALDLPYSDLVQVIRGRKAAKPLVLPTPVGPERFASILQRSLGKTDYNLFLSLLPSWEGSIKELIGTVRSLTLTPTRKAKKAS